MGGPVFSTRRPSVPGTSVASAVHATRLTVTWTPSAGTAGNGIDGNGIDGNGIDGNGIDGYDLYRDGVLIASPMTTKYKVTGLTAGTAYSFTVLARDKAGPETRPAIVRWPRPRSPRRPRPSRRTVESPSPSPSPSPPPLPEGDRCPIDA